MMLSLKIRLADDIRRVSVVDSTSFSELVELIRKLYDTALPLNYVLKYTDEGMLLVPFNGWARERVSYIIVLRFVIRW
jgi:hypothetical protein